MSVPCEVTCVCGRGSSRMYYLCFQTVYRKWAPVSCGRRNHTIVCISILLDIVSVWYQVSFPDSQYSEQPCLVNIYIVHQLDLCTHLSLMGLVYFISQLKLPSSVDYHKFRSLQVLLISVLFEHWRVSISPVNQIVLQLARFVKLSPHLNSQTGLVFKGSWNQRRLGSIAEF